ncbi:MAG: carotenoid biosynthesis protein [Desulfobacterales bacterium]|jgi:hypothetical protein
MLLSELAAFATVAIYIVAHTSGQPKERHFISRIILVCAASWIAEESCILLYDFYDYSLNWRLFLAHLPLLVIVIWPIIVHSAWNLASQILQPGRRLVPLTAAAIVLTDASLIEPVGVQTGLWSWKQPGLFDVPPIGILGWAYFAFLCVLFFEQRKRRNGAKWVSLLILIVPVIGTHMLLLITWWGALRWIKTSIDPMLAAGSAWALSLLLVSVILKNRTGTRIMKKTLLLRLLGALCLFTWLALNSNESTLLIVYATAFAPPYLTLMAQQYLATSPATRGA